MPPNIKKVLQPHPNHLAEIAKAMAGADDVTDTKKQHRMLTEVDSTSLTSHLRRAVITHHNEPEKIKRIQQGNKRLQRQGAPPRPLYPLNESTRKGNIAEIALAEYVIATERLALPVYRLRYNPNIEQSMKGDDVLAFDVDAKPARILVGEAKFRGTPRREDVEDIVEQLLKSEKARIPASLQFVADQLYRQQENELAMKIEALQFDIGRGRPRIDYVGLLLGPSSSTHIVKTYTPATTPRRIAMISLAVGDPDRCVSDCFQGLS